MTAAPPAMTAANPLATLLTLEELSRRAETPTQLAFVMVNDSRMLLPYHQAVLHLDDGGVAAVSAVATIDANAPFIQWLNRLLRGIDDSGPVRIGASDLADPDRSAQWSDWLPAHALVLPLRTGRGQVVGRLLFSRPHPWPDEEITLLARAADMYGHAWGALHPPAPWRTWRQAWRRWPRRRWAIAAAALAVLALPVRLSVLAPADVAAANPAVIRAPLDGTIALVAVRPNQTVREGQTLFEMDRTVIAGKLEVAERGQASAQAELDQATQAAFFDPRAKAQLSLVRARLDERQAEAAQLRDLLNRTVIAAPRDGVVVMDDPSEWVGRPVGIGEKVLAVADPAEVEVNAWLAPADLIPLPDQSPVTLFLDSAPLDPVDARLFYVAFEPAPLPDGQLAYRVRARLDAALPPPRLGAKGTARLDSGRVSLAYWLARRPLAVIRRTIGW